VAQPRERRHPSAEHRPDHRRDERDEADGDATLIGAVSHVDQERARQRLGELIGQLVQHDEGENLDRPWPREKTEEG
jgi:hypothetical protein